MVMVEGVQQGPVLVGTFFSTTSSSNETSLRTTRPSRGGSRRKGTTTSGAQRKTFSWKTPGKAPRTPSWKQQPKPTPARPGTLGGASTPS